MAPPMRPKGGEPGRAPRELIKPGVVQLQAYDPHKRPGHIKLDANEYPYPLPPAVRDAVVQALAAVEAHRYPDPEAERLRETVGRWVGAPPEMVLLGNGSDEVIQMVVMACGAPQASVLMPTPTFAMYGIAAQALDQRPVEVPLTREWALDIPRMLEAIERERPRVIFLATPNNPTANCFQDEGVRELIEAAPGLIVIDEAYYPFSGQTFLPLIQTHPHLAILRTLSKVGMAGLRVGILVADPQLIEQVNKVRAPYNLNVYSQAAAAVVLDRWEMIASGVREVLQERERLRHRLAALPGVTVFPSQANFLLVHFAAGGAKVWEALGARGILVRRYGGPSILADCLRITVGTPAENDALMVGLQAITADMQPLIRT